MPKDSFKGTPDSQRAFPATRWRSAGTLESVWQFNEHVLSTVSAMASSESALGELDLIKDSRELWLNLEPKALKKAAMSPVLLVDVHFNNDDWWKWVVRGKKGNWKGIRTEDCFTVKVARDLMRAALMLAWSATRESQVSVAVLFGMSKKVATLMGALTPQDIEVIASRHSRELRPRWEDMPSFWRNLLSSARGEDGTKLREIHLHSLQLIASELHGGAS